MLGNTRFTTINTDAGVKEGKAAIAYWIRSEFVWLTGSQELKRTDLNSTEAEMSAIVIALTKVTQDEYLRTADRLVINSDSKGALSWLKHDTAPTLYKDYLDKIYKIIPKSKIRFKWVKGHSRGNSRKWVNNWCDKEVRKQYKT